MSIVRELLVKIGFKTDKQSIEETNSAISGFKARFLIAASAATYAFGKISQFFSDIATATLDSDQLATTLGTSLKELIAIQKAADQVGRLDFKQTNAAFLGLNKLLNNFRSGMDSSLTEIARGLKFEIDREGGPQKLFDQILNSLNQIETVQDRIRISSNIFGDELGPKIANIAANITEFNKATEGFLEIGQEFENSVSAAKAYEDAVKNLNNSWEKFTMSLSTTVLPVLRNIIEYLTIISDFTRSIFTMDTSGLKGALNSASRLFDPFFEFTGLNKISDYFKSGRGGESLLNSESAQKELIDYIENREGYSYRGNIPQSQMPTITNYFEIDASPEGINKLYHDVYDSIKNAVDDAVYGTFKEIQANNPQVE